MSKQPKLTAKNQEKNVYELLRLELAYLKKLKAFRENPEEAFLEKNKLP
ncbi:hypothetical protein M3649_21075 [Ureibacillus chungkukjangi]|nr:hypothetical protein [Ureibacillus chungkukjangi]MCM3390580.1 hypothetical protein [Ureibacillus chungkukjangi]